MTSSPSQSKRKALVSWVKKRVQAALPVTCFLDDDLLFGFGQIVGLVAPFRLQVVAAFLQLRVRQDGLGARVIEGVPLDVEEDELLVQLGIQVLDSGHVRRKVGIAGVGGEVEHSV